MITFDSIVSKEKNIADKFYVRVKLSNDGVEECRFFKFHKDPTNKEVRDEVKRFLDIWNQPEPVESLRERKYERQQKRQALLDEIQIINNEITSRGETP